MDSSKPRIFINMHYLEIGGAETALIGLLHTLDPQRVKVDLFLNDYRGEMMRYIPDWVNVLPVVPAYTMIERPMREVLWRGFIKILLARLWAKCRFACYMRCKHPKDGSAIFGYVGHCVTPVLPSLQRLGEYDLAISFLAPHNIVLDKVSAKKKMCWIHTDYTSIDVNTDLELPVWSGYDYIAAISEDAARAFLQVFPSLRHKVMKFENILTTDFIRLRSEGERPMDMLENNARLSLLTVGRYSYPKKLEEIPAICHHLIELGNDVRWYIIGYGGSDQYIRDAIRKEGMENHVVLLGKRENPYPYIKACDWYVQPSRYEGKSVVVREAQVLGRPVIVTAYPTAESQVEDGVDGLIVPMPVRECAEAISRAIKDHALHDRLSVYVENHDYGNESEAEKLYRIIKA